WDVISNGVDISKGLALGLVVCIRLRRTSLRLISTDEARYRVVGNVVQFEFILVFVDGVATGGFGEWDGYTLGVSVLGLGMYLTAIPLTEGRYLAAALAFGQEGSCQHQINVDTTDVQQQEGGTGLRL
ncbi:hypothetical protein CTAM01_00459, partial [Colletotrichum tamarilloi]